MSTFELFYAGDTPDELQLQDRCKEISRMLHNHNCEVTFVKKDGEIRTMPCTLRESVLPSRDASKVTEAKAPNYTTMSVWCTDKKEWRSFRVANVTKVKVLND